MRAPRRGPAARTRPLGVCANRGRTFRAASNAPTVYCALACSPVAKAVRYGRQKAAQWDGRQMPEDIAYAVRIKIAHAVSGGYDASARTLPPATRRAVWERDAGRCVLCAAEGKEMITSTVLMRTLGT